MAKTGKGKMIKMICDCCKVNEVHPGEGKMTKDACSNKVISIWDLCRQCIDKIIGEYNLGEGRSLPKFNR